MQTDAELVQLCAAIYSPQAPGFWDHYYDGSASDGICAGIKDNALIFRGSVTSEDWERDFYAAMHTPIDHPQLGQIHAGFYEGLDVFLPQVFQLLGVNPVFSGHSLGAARAWDAAALYIVEGGSPGHIGVFGSPRPGCQQLKDILAPYSKSSYRNGLDPVPEVPFILPDFPVVAPLDPTPIRIVPTDWSEGFMAWHNINLYAQGMQ